MLATPAPTVQFWNIFTMTTIEADEDAEADEPTQQGEQRSEPGFLPRNEG